MLLFLILLCAAKLLFVRAACGEFEWMCDDGSCISEHQICDGSAECLDRSDEIAENCIHLAHDCQRYAYTCSYGACITGSFKCNNITDCADNSDELDCLNEDPAHHQGRCGANQMQCLRSQECIERDRMCDGDKDCSDGSDETVEVCAGFRCPRVAFRCGYGGCVAGIAKCNGKMECADGSDEAWQLCNTPRKKKVPLLVPTPGPTTEPSKGRDSDPGPQESAEGLGCQLPLDRPELIFKVHPNNYTIQPKQGVLDFETVHIECQNAGRSFYLTSIICENGTLSSNIKSCINYCDKKLLEGTSTHYNVYYNYQQIEPDVLTKGIPSGSFVDISCRIGFTSRTENGRQTLICKENGEFDKERKSCQLDCGKPLPNIAPLTRNGIPTKPIDLPWHVPLYEIQNGTYTYFCSGSILSPSIVLSAAHCFPKHNNKLKIDERRYLLMAGKYHKAYDYPNDGEPQERYAKYIYVWDHYVGDTNSYLQDIALIHLDSPFRFHQNISAVCRPRMLRYAANSVPDDFLGLIAGFNEISNKLESLNLTAISLHSCQRKTQEGNLAPDKFCLTIVNDVSLCRGDSGSGYAEKFQSKYHLLGILSYSPSTKDDCARNGYVAMTNARFMEDDLRNTIDNWLKEDEKLY